MFQFELPAVLFQLPPNKPQFQPLLALQPNKRKNKSRGKRRQKPYFFDVIAGDASPAPPYRGFLRMGSPAEHQAEAPAVKLQLPPNKPQSQPKLAMQPNKRIVLPALASGTYC